MEGERDQEIEGSSGPVVEWSEAASRQPVRSPKLPVLRHRDNESQVRTLTSPENGERPCSPYSPRAANSFLKKINTDRLNNKVCIIISTRVTIAKSMG